MVWARFARRRCAGDERWIMKALNRQVHTPRLNDWADLNTHGKELDGVSEVRLGI